MASQQVPVRMYRSEERLNIATPMPGVEPQDIHISLSQNGELTLTAEARGRFKDVHDVLMNEWEPGDYSRSLALDTQVDGTAATATYENGVLVVSLPISTEFKPGEIELRRESATEGQRAGVSGHPSDAGG